MAWLGISPVRYAPSYVMAFAHLEMRLLDSEEVRIRIVDYKARRYAPENHW